MTRFSRVVLCAIVTAGVCAPVFMRADGQVNPPGAPVAIQGTSQPAGRTAQQIGVDLMATGMKLREAMENGKALQSADGRKRAAPAVRELAPKMIGLLNELVASDARAKDMVAANTAELNVFLLCVDDPATVAANATGANSTGALADHAKAQRAAADFVQASDAAGQDKAIDAFDAILKTSKSDPAVMQLLGFFTQIDPASPAVGQHLVKVLKADGGPAGEQLAMHLDAQMKLEAHLDKPIEIKGPKLGGGTFTTADWKGKVVLVDFWASWADSSRGDVPRIKKLYADYHDKGLEIVGVSCDNSADDLKKFLDANKEMVWPQVFDPAKPGWNAIATQLDVIAIPTRFLIDRNGVLRAVDAFENGDEFIPKLLAEKAQ
jgi:thiol-disulfide isomerase/thioredoxin